MIRATFAAAALAALAGAAAAQTTEIPFALDWKFEGPAAPFFLAIDNGHFAAEGLEVEISAGQGSLDAIPKVATGAFPLGFADVNSLVRFLDSNPGAPVTAVMIVYDKPPFSVVGRKSLGIEGIEDIEGMTLGAPPPDGAWAQFPAFAEANGIDMSTVTVEPVGFPTREPMLAEGEVDGVTGFSFSSYLNLVRLGVPEEDLTTILMADHGLDLYGNAIIANTDFAEANPEVVRGFLNAVVKGTRDAIADPEAGARAVVDRSPASDVAFEARRLRLAIDDNILTDAVRAGGMGDIDPDRMARAMGQLAVGAPFEDEPLIEDVFTSEYLPEDRSLD